METIKYLINQGESRRRGYNDYNRGSDLRAASSRENIALTDMTLAEIMQHQALPVGHPSRLFAVGFYQIIPKTLIVAVNALQLDKNKQFTPQLQDFIFVNYLATAKKGRGDLERYIKGASDDLAAANTSLAKEWASIAYTGNSGYYDGVGNNAALISSDRVRAALIDARLEYKKAVAAGASDPYAIALGCATLGAADQNKKAGGSEWTDYL